MNHMTIKPQFSVVVHSEDMAELKSGVWNSISHLLQDENKEGVLSTVLLGLQANLSTAEIAKNNALKRSKVEAVIDYLQQLGVLQTGHESFIDRYVDQVAMNFKQPGKAMTEGLMPLVLLGDPVMSKMLKNQLTALLPLEVTYEVELFDCLLKGGDEWLFDALAQEHFMQAFHAWRGKFLVFTSRHVNPILAARLNRIAYVLNIPWLHLALDGPFLFIGPCFPGKSGPCYDCFETRIGMNLRESANYQKYKNALFLHQVHHADVDPLAGVTANLLVSHGMLEILNYLTTRSTFTRDKVLSIFLPTMEFVYHEVLRLPACRTCGSIPYRDDTQTYFDFQQLIQEGQS